MKNQTIKSDISGKDYQSHEVCKGKTLKPGLFKFICSLFPEFSEQSNLSFSELNDLRKAYLEKILTDEWQEVSGLEKQVLNVVQNNSILAEKLLPENEHEPTYGERLADKIASFGGSWAFIITFFSFLMLWMLVNVLMFSKAFDPFPFILLNLILSCLAAIQAPIIMMSQNRQETKDRIRAEKDFKINLKAELELRLLHDKIDHMLVHQNQRLLEIQELQTEYLHEIVGKLKTSK